MNSTVNKSGHLLKKSSHAPQTQRNLQQQSIGNSTGRGSQNRTGAQSINASVMSGSTNKLSVTSKVTTRGTEFDKENKQRLSNKTSISVDPMSNQGRQSIVPKLMTKGLNETASNS